MFNGKIEFSGGRDGGMDICDEWIPQSTFTYLFYGEIFTVEIKIIEKNGRPSIWRGEASLRKSYNCRYQISGGKCKSVKDALSQAEKYLRYFYSSIESSLRHQFYNKRNSLLVCVPKGDKLHPFMSAFSGNNLNEIMPVCKTILIDFTKMHASEFNVFSGGYSRGGVNFFDSIRSIE